MKSLCAVLKVHTSMREWLSGGVSPCQGEGRGFESRLVLFCCLFTHLTYIQIKILKTEMLHYYATATSPFFSLTDN